MLGAISGDVIGSVYERNAVKTTDFELFTPKSTFTDDTVLTVAIADALMNNKNFTKTVRAYAIRYPNAGYGGTFKKWMIGLIDGPYDSWGNGSAMRVSPVAFVFDDLQTVVDTAASTAVITHNHPEGVKGAQATAAAIFVARTGGSKADIKDLISSEYGYDLDRTLAEIRPEYKFDVSCQGSVPESIIAFLESENVEEAIRNAVSLGGDADTMACIAGAIAQAYYKEIPAAIAMQTRDRLPQSFLDILDAFNKQYEVSW